ncbi:MAG: hypothetical protein JRD04_04540 [Deltaproteobacteria bacterium]|nr:hypothetical protein [Deltaproteobacteria bacterium]
MFEKTFRKPGRQRLWLLVLLWILLVWGCHKDTKPTAYPPRFHQEIKKVVVMGFRAAMTEGPGPSLVENPITGTSFLTEPVPEDVVRQMNNVLFDELIGDKRWTLVSPGQARGVLASIIDGDKKMEQTPREMLQSVGKAFEADAVLTGRIYRWQKRVGSDFAVDKPASVSFDLVLVRPSSGAILWRSHFDKTQQSLFANLFDFDTYVKSSGRWLTAEKLADIGLEKLIGEMPGVPEPKKEGKKETSADHSGN